MYNDNMDGADKVDGNLQKTNIYQAPYIRHNEFFPLSGVSTEPSPEYRRIFVQELLLYFVNSTLIASPFQVVKTHCSSANKEK